MAAFLENAVQNVEKEHADFAALSDTNVISVSAVERDLSLPADLRESNTPPSLTSRAIDVMIFAVLGGALGVIVLLGMYFLDPRLKNLKDIFVSEAHCEVIKMEDEHAARKLIARAKAVNAKRLLLCAPIEDGKLAEFVKALSDTLAAVHSDVKVTCFDAQSANWLMHFDSAAPSEGYEIYCYNSIDPNALYYLAGKVDASVFFVDQSRAKIKTLRALAEQLEGNPYLCTVLHSVGNVYLD